MAIAFKVPELGDDVESGIVVSVMVSVGDTISVDQPVLELETDKAVLEVPSSVSGVIEEIMVKTPTRMFNKNRGAPEMMIIGS